MDRMAALNRSLSIANPPADLSRHGWDIEKPLVELRPEHLISALSKFAAGVASDAEIEKWANSIEGRDDIGYSTDSTVGEVLHELANPYLTHPLSHSRALELVALLQSVA